ncbi:prevent-host-death family protein [Bryocella elongata]|uniref:Antitoxin n=1 Tax=Bryocella elongata TaxID=863522 RepID=A0A1H6A809_9BACT|nr:type II toxin-antitoxin system prevent-host-death family antitoxin [Bryocella elongata]SEG44883.1 prevent-host-death family protein [Bryocella elongata]
METVNIHEAKTHLSRLIAKAVNGEPFIIAKAGKPLVQVSAIAPVEPPKRKFGFLKGQFTTPENFKDFGREEIEEMFYGNPDKFSDRKSALKKKRK